MAVAPEASSGAPAAAVAPTVLPNHPAQTLQYDQLAEGDHCVCTVDVARGKVDVTLNISEWRWGSVDKCGGLARGKVDVTLDISEWRWGSVDNCGGLARGKVDVTLNISEWGWRCDGG